MTESANVRSLDAIRQFAGAVLKFQEEARLSVSALEMQLLKFMGWLERDRPGYWKREIENCYREMSEARVRLHQCKMKKTGDYKPTCFEEKKDLERAKRDLEFAQKQVPVVKHWVINAHHEANEYHGRGSQLTRTIEREIPRLLALLHQVVDRLEAYGNVQVRGMSLNVPMPDAAAQQTAPVPDSSDSGNSTNPVDTEERETPE